MIETDPKLKEKLALLKSRALLPLRQYVDEALEVLRSSPAPAPHSSKIISARMKYANSRSRLIETRLIIVQELSTLRSMHSNLHDYLLSKYNTGYLGNIKNARSREAVVSKALAPISNRISKLESATEVVDTVVKDLDSKAFAVRDIMTAIQLGERESH